MAKILKVWPRSGDGQPGAARDPRRGRIRRAGTYVTLGIVFAAITLIISPGLRLVRPQVFVNEVWSEAPVYAPFAVRVVDDSAARAAQRDELSQEKVFTVNDAVETRASGQVRALLTAAAAAATAKTTPAAFHRSVVSQLGIPIRRETAEILLANAANVRMGPDLENIVRHLLTVRGVTAEKPLLEAAESRGRLVMHGGLTPTTQPLSARVLGYPAEFFRYLRETHLPTYELPALVRAAYLDVIEQVVQPNVVFDRQATALRRDALVKSLVRETPVARGSLVVSTGDVLSPFQASVLMRLFDEGRHRALLRAAGNGVFVALAMFFVLLYARKFRKGLRYTSRNILMVALPVIFALSLGRFGLNVGGDSILMALAFPAGMVAMLGTILFGSRFAIVLSTIGSMLYGLAVGLDFAHILVAVVGGFTGCTSLYTFKERREVLMAGVRLAVANCLAILAVGLVRQTDVIGPAGAMAAIANGFACYVLTIGAMPLFEALFGVTTDVRLMELTSTSHPLLQQLEDKAPGTYQHVLSVTKLAEAAADDVGANFLLVRAGAYFHDIGKMLKPKYFTENQVTPEEKRIHSRLSPYMSNLIIKNHVKEGIELGRRHGLPDKVIDFIPQHHGTGLIKYFYHQAIQRAEANDLVHEDEFRYPGPKPQTKEAAIVMIADSVDAIATAKLSNATVTEDDVRKLVRDTIMDKFGDGQFDEANMTMRDLHLISESFVRSLLSRYHQRIDYPTLQKREVRDATHPETSPAAR